MALTPDELLDSQVFLQEINALENEIDNHLQNNFSGPEYPIPLLEIDKPRKIVQDKISEIYDKAGWKIRFLSVDDASQCSVLITQKTK